MANDKKMVEQITSMEEDFAKWYTDVVKKADLIDYSSVKGCMIIRPYGYAIWENIQKLLDARFKKTGVENIYMPMFIPESLLQREKDHVEGFAPEVAWVTHGGNERLTERLCVRPTSETLFCDEKIINNVIFSPTSQVWDFYARSPSVLRSSRIFGSPIHWEFAVCEDYPRR